MRLSQPIGRWLAPLLGAAAVTVGVLIGTAGAAGAAQTATWGIVAAPSHGFRAALSHPADGATVTDAVLVWNRTAAPLVVNLSVLDTHYTGGAYQFGPPRAGLAAGVRLATYQVALAGHEEARVPVTIREPRGTRDTVLAGIAAEAAPINDGALSIQQRLVILVQATPTSKLVPLARPDVAVWGIIAAGILAVVVGLFAWERRLAGPSGADRNEAGPSGADRNGAGPSGAGHRGALPRRSQRGEAGDGEPVAGSGRSGRRPVAQPG